MSLRTTRESPDLVFGWSRKSEVAQGMLIREKIDGQTYQRWIRRVLSLMAVLLVVQYTL